MSIGNFKWLTNLALSSVFIAVWLTDSLRQAPCAVCLLLLPAYSVPVNYSQVRKALNPEQEKCIAETRNLLLHPSVLAEASFLVIGNKSPSFALSL